MVLAPDVQREYQRTWVAARRAAYFQDKVCVDCGSDENLELDHVDPEKKTSHRIWSWSKERQDIEIAKCVPRCHDCHLAKTARDRAAGILHPSNTTWAHGCRCQECRNVHANYQASYRKRVGHR